MLALSHKKHQHKADTSWSSLSNIFELVVMVMGHEKVKNREAGKEKWEMWEMKWSVELSRVKYQFLSVMW